jgi:hypothetical protein
MRNEENSMASKLKSSVTESLSNRSVDDKQMSETS